MDQLYNYITFYKIPYHFVRLNDEIEVEWRQKILCVFVLSCYEKKCIVYISSFMSKEMEC